MTRDTFMTGILSLGLEGRVNTYTTSDQNLSKVTTGGALGAETHGNTSTARQQPFRGKKPSLESPMSGA